MAASHLVFPRKGDIVIYRDFIGVVRYVGPIAVSREAHPPPQSYVGLELAEPTGNCDGTMLGIRYFHTQTDAPNFGLMIPLEAVERIVPPLEMLQQLTAMHHNCLKTSSKLKSFKTCQNENLRLTAQIARLEKIKSPKPTPKTPRRRTSRPTRLDSFQVDEFHFVNYDMKRGNPLQLGVDFSCSSASDFSTDEEFNLLPFKRKTPQRRLSQSHSLAELIDRVSSDAKQKWKPSSSRRVSRSKNKRKRFVPRIQSCPLPGEEATKSRSSQPVKQLVPRWSPSMETSVPELSNFDSDESMVSLPPLPILAGSGPSFYVETDVQESLCEKNFAEVAEVQGCVLGDIFAR